MLFLNAGRNTARVCCEIIQIKRSTKRLNEQAKFFKWV